ncbi:VanZ family protein [Salinactinospora qingdaonensis]|uniref:VanZ like family protein n=1 Tax=Salinactinospora qingdaonensis TaxID=702744 RepID=A0ABP7FH07_9ACTN
MKLLNASDGGGVGMAVTAPVAAVAFAIVVAVALFLADQHRRYGRLWGWSGQVTRAVPLVGCLLASYAVAPLPQGPEIRCSATPTVWEPAATLTPLTLSGVAHASIALGAFLPVGILAHYRYRRGLGTTAVFAATLAAGVELLHLTALVGLYPCPYRVAATDDVVFGILGASLGWLFSVVLTPPLARGWPAAVPDLLPPGLARRALGHILDVGLWWFGAHLLTAALVAGSVVSAEESGPVLAAALLALAALVGPLVSLPRRDRCTPGRAAVHLAIVGIGHPHPAPRWRVALRSALLHGPIVALVCLGLGWWAIAVMFTHASTALVRYDQVGLVDLLTATRVATRTAVDGELPRRLVKHGHPAPTISGAR